MYTVDLEIRVEDALAELPDRVRQEVMEVIASVLVRRDSWPALGSGAEAFGPQTWILFSAYADGIDVYDVGWTGLA